MKYTTIIVLLLLTQTALAADLSASVPWSWEWIAEKIFTTLLVPLLTAYIAIQLALGKFRKEKWWERKAKAYYGLIEALYDSLQFSDEYLEAQLIPNLSDFDSHGGFPNGLNSDSTWQTGGGLPWDHRSHFGTTSTHRH